MTGPRDRREKIGSRVKALKALGVRPAHIARQLGIDITAVYYHISPSIRQKSLARSTQRRINNKKFAIVYKGGKCVKCGYNRCSDALVFHHIDPFKKELQIAMADEVLVVNVNGYIGERTAIEIRYAEERGKPVHYLE